MTFGKWARAGIAALILLLFVSGCGSEPPKKPRGPRVAYLQAKGPPCRFNEKVPYHISQTTCIEVVYDQVTPPQAAPTLMGLALGPDGTLYMALTASGEIWAMRDQDGDQFLDAPYPVAAGLRLPTSLAVYEGALYVASVGGLVRLDSTGSGRFDQKTLLVPDLAAPTGFWPGSVAIGPDKRLYVSLGANCDTCTGGDIQPGKLVSYALDGSDERIEATGLRDPADFAWDPKTGGLWIVDGGRVVPGASNTRPPDELDRVKAGANYGFPYCYGDRVPDPALTPPQGSSSADYCAQTEPPAFTFKYQSSPGGIVFYPFDSGSEWTSWPGDLIVTLSGSWDLPEPAGYALVAVGFGPDAQPDGTTTIIAPASVPNSPFASYSLARYSLMGWSFFPHHPVDVVVDAQGWLYVSEQEGRILRFRPTPAAKAPPAPTPTPTPGQK